MLYVNTTLLHEEIRAWGVLPAQTLCLSSKQNLHCNAYAAVQWNVSRLVNRLWTSQQKLGCITPSYPSSTNLNRKSLHKKWKNAVISTAQTKIHNFLVRQKGKLTKNTNQEILFEKWQLVIGKHTAQRTEPHTLVHIEINTWTEAAFKQLSTTRIIFPLWP